MIKLHDLESSSRKLFQDVALPSIGDYCIRGNKKSIVDLGPNYNTDPINLLGLLSPNRFE